MPRSIYEHLVPKQADSGDHQVKTFKLDPCQREVRLKSLLLSSNQRKSVLPREKTAAFRTVAGLHSCQTMCFLCLGFLLSLFSLFFILFSVPLGLVPTPTTGILKLASFSFSPCYFLVAANMSQCRDIQNAPLSQCEPGNWQ